MLADAEGGLARALGLDMEPTFEGVVRLRRSAMLVDDGVIKVLNLEEAAKFTEASGAAFLLSQIKTKAKR